MDTKILERITINPAINHGKPSIRNMRFSVAQLLELLAAGTTTEELLNEYPYLESEDINACLLYAAQMANTKNIVLA
jgi:uncharacterized protein (DUF433 family)